MEDYQLGRKGPQASGTTAPGTGMFGNSTFGTSSGTTTFGSGINLHSLFTVKLCRACYMLEHHQ